MTEEETAIANLEQTVSNLTYNQQGLVQENNMLRKTIEDLQNKKNVPAIYAKMLAIKKDLGYVGKDQKNMGQGWSFRGIDQFLNALKPLLDNHGVGMLTKTHQNAEQFVTNEKTGKTSKNTRIMMEYIFFADDGSQVSSFIPAEGVDPGDKGTNKALSAALKYCLIQTFSVPTEDIAEADKENPSIDGGTGKSSAAKVKKETSTEDNPEPKAPARKRFKRPENLTNQTASGDL